MKTGLFTLGFRDIEIPTAGLSISVMRTYDSRDKSMGDFGVGWRQEFNTLRLRTNACLEQGGYVIFQAAVMNLTPTSEHKVSITLPTER